MLAQPNPPIESQVLVAEYWLSDNKERYNATTFKIDRLVKSNQGLECLYNIANSLTRSEFTLSMVPVDDRYNTSFTSFYKDKESFNPASTIVFNQEKAQEFRITTEKPFAVDYNNVAAVSIAHALFAGSKILEGQEAKVLENTIRRIGKLTPTLPNRL